MIFELGNVGKIVDITFHTLEDVISDDVSFARIITSTIFKT